MGRAGFNVRYDFEVNGDEAKVVRNGESTSMTFSTKDRDSATSTSALHRFLVSIGQNGATAHAICEAIENGSSVNSVFGTK